MRLSKSAFFQYLQCPKMLWLVRHRPDLLPEEDQTSPKTPQQIEGEEIEKYAYRLFPSGHQVYHPDFEQNITQTQKLLQKKTPFIFQGAIATKKLFCRSDILEYYPNKRKWHLWEIKSSTKIKEEHLIDLAFQKICLEKAGYSIDQLKIIYINNEYIRQGEIQPGKLLHQEIITQEVHPFIKEVKKLLKPALKTLKAKKEPRTIMLKQCSYGSENCPFKPYCHRDIPQPSIYDLTLREEILEELIDQNILKMEEVPEEKISYKLKKKYQQAVKTKKPVIEREKIKEELAKYEYPLYFLDYETYSSGLPLFDHYHPYEQIPFQYSLHSKENPHAELKHYEFLFTTSQDPTQNLARELAEKIGPRGTILTWNMPFEKKCNDSLAKNYPAYQKFFQELNARIQDLMIIFRKGYYVDEKTQGSYSIKKILPALTDLSYQNLPIQEGREASQQWRTMIDLTTPPLKKEQIRQNLLKYCKLDTLAMVKIWEKLKKIC